MKIKRRWFRRRASWIDSRRLVFLDESGVQTNMVRLYGRAPVSQRLHARAPAGHWKTTTLLSAIGIRGVIGPAYLALAGSIDAASFRPHVERMLVSALKPGRIVVMDNLASHNKVAGVRAAIKAASGELGSECSPRYDKAGVFSEIRQSVSVGRSVLRDTTSGL